MPHCADHAQVYTSCIQVFHVWQDQSSQVMSNVRKQARHNWSMLIDRKEAELDLGSSSDLYTWKSHHWILHSNHSFCFTHLNQGDPGPAQTLVWAKLGRWGPRALMWTPKVMLAHVLFYPYNIAFGTKRDKNTYENCQVMPTPKRIKKLTQVCSSMKTGKHQCKPYVRPPTALTQSNQIHA